MEFGNEATRGASELPLPAEQLEGAAAVPCGVDGEDDSARPLAAAEKTKKEAAAGEDALQEKLLVGTKPEPAQSEVGSPKFLSRVLLVAAALAAVGVVTAGAALYGHATFAASVQVSPAVKELRKLQAELHNQNALVAKLKTQAEQADRNVTHSKSAVTRALKVRIRPPEEAACAKEFEACDIVGSTNCCQSGCTCQGDTNYKMCKPVNTYDSCLSSLEVTLQGELEDKQAAVNHSDRAAKAAADALVEASSKLESINERVEEARSAVEAEEATSDGGVNASTGGQRLLIDRGAASGRATRDAESWDEDWKKDGDSWNEDWK